jgi:CheY-like chemotaxis protein
MATDVLVVDDDGATRAATVAALELEGYTADAVPDGAAALDYLHAQPAPRLVLLDMMMPVMDGWTFLLQRHREAALTAIPVVIVTASGGIDAPAARALGADDVLRKPADPDDVLTAVRRYCPRPGG